MKPKLSAQEVEQLEDKIIRDHCETLRAIAQGKASLTCQQAALLLPLVLEQICSAPDPVASETSAPRMAPLGPEEVDIDSRGTFDVSRRGRWRDYQSVRIEPAWFVPREKGLARLSKRLLSESSPSSGSATKTATFRLAAILDWHTGAVHLVSVFISCRVVRVTRFSDKFGRVCTRRKSIALAEVLSVTMADGRRRFEVIGSARTKAPTEFHLQTFRNRREFREQFAGPVMEAQRAVQSCARVTQVRMEACSVEMGPVCQALEEPCFEQEESSDDGEADSEDRSEATDRDSDDSPALKGWPLEAYLKECTRDPGPLNLSRADVWLLREWFPHFTTVDELVDLLTVSHSDGRPVIGDGVYEIIERIAGSDVSFFTLAEELGMEQALRTYGY